MPAKRVVKRRPPAATTYGRGARGKLVVNVPPPPNKLPQSTRLIQAGFFIPFLLLEAWFAWSFVLEMFARCNYADAYILPNWCLPNGKVFTFILLVMSLTIIVIGVFAARLAYRQGIRWRFLAIYIAALLIGQSMLTVILKRLFL